MRLPPPGYWYTSSFFLEGSGPLLEVADPAFSRSPLGRANTFSFLSLLSTFRVSRKCSSSFTLFLIANRFSSFYHFLYLCLVPCKLLYGQYLFVMSSCMGEGEGEGCINLGQSSTNRLKYSTFGRNVRNAGAVV